MKILSLFDGISCGQVALKRAGIKVNDYYASEIDDNAIAITQLNFPNTHQVGDVLNLKGEHLPDIDLVMGGSPCQGFSVAGKMLNFEDPRSKLFFEFSRLVKEKKPKYFLLENVKMKKECLDAISLELGVQPRVINSAYFSAQSRERVYWTNIPFELKDEVDPTVIADILDKEPHPELEVKTLLTYIDSEKAGSLLKQVGYFKADKQGWRVYGIHGKSPTLIADSGGLAGPANALIHHNGKIRKMSIHEVQRLQTLPIDYTDGLPRGKQLRAIGNGWTVNVLAHIFKGIK
jgi:site-specific DNA-cytosine methylase